ncbi:helix-turn-helix domain-containing protein [Planomicrobium sp. CPCC 101110]|uniref:helix-turn-helix domain-containing protein n=1 Tax=Planomicrobium sp. CPCC 101110 TaxID=2599619 RepID=UPI0011B37DBB|nr:XRE family transcriptional regulator [Planomicrobium sp. CPCC 101110]TWT25339.1 helix-turn-helix domain-containing protein [Planomicrobium sp. CPCC 101110]
MTHDSMGIILKNLRKERKLTLKELAEQTGVSISFLSQVERGKSSATLESLKRFADALDVNPGVFFEENTGRDELAERKALFHYKDLSHGVKHSNLSPILVTLYPGENEWSPFAHSGFEFLFVLEGLLTVEIDGERSQLSEQESVLFDASKKHYWANHTEKDVRFLVVSSKN